MFLPSLLVFASIGFSIFLSIPTLLESSFVRSKIDWKWIFLAHVSPAFIPTGLAYLLSASLLLVYFVAEIQQLGILSSCIATLWTLGFCSFVVTKYTLVYFTSHEVCWLEYVA